MAIPDYDDQGEPGSQPRDNIRVDSMSILDKLQTEGPEALFEKFVPSQSASPSLPPEPSVLNPYQQSKLRGLLVWYMKNRASDGGCPYDSNTVAVACAFRGDLPVFPNSVPDWVHANVEGRLAMLAETERILSKPFVPVKLSAKRIIQDRIAELEEVARHPDNAAGARHIIGQKIDELKIVLTLL